ncbi:MAG: M4 family metallopeptidase [Saprospiraceae bacterium]
MIHYRYILFSVLLGGWITGLAQDKFHRPLHQTGASTPPLKSISRSWHAPDQVRELPKFKPATLFWQDDYQVLKASYDRTSLLIEARDQLVGKRNRPDASDALQLLQAVGLQIPYEELQQESDDLGWRHTRFQQVFAGYPVYGGEVIVHQSNQGLVRIMGQVKLAKQVPQGMHFLEARLKAPEALHIGYTDVAQYTKVEEKLPVVKGMAGVKREEANLMVWMESEQPRLIWYLRFYPNWSASWDYFVDATTGEVLEHHSNQCSLMNELEAGHIEKLHAHPDGDPLDGPIKGSGKDLAGATRDVNAYLENGTYYMVDVSRPMFATIGTETSEPEGVIWTFDARNSSPDQSFNAITVNSNNNTWSDPKSVSAHYNGSIAYEYYRQTFGRNSINGLGGNIVSYVNVVDKDNSQMDNAYWNGAAMFYGNGKNAFKPLAEGLDVAGHEMSHGVIQNTAGLEYRNEAGALNESFADVFGVLIDRDDWTVGEDVVLTSVFKSGALRSMQNPHNGGSKLGDPGWQPAHYSERYTGTQDNGGVHVNSGITNFAFFKIASQIGKDDAEKIYYRTLTKYLTRSSNFVDLRNGVLASASDLLGASSSAIGIINASFDAVGIGSSGGSEQPTDVSENNGDEYIVFVNNEDENLYLATPSGQIISDALSDQPVLSRPSMTDDGTVLVFVSQDHIMRYVNFDWQQGQYGTGILDDQVPWRNVAISKDGNRVAALTQEEDNLIHVYDFNLDQFPAFELTNPTFTEGVSTGDVLRADAMEFDFTGEYLVYDCESRLKNANGADVTYWDIGFLHVFDNATNQFADGGIQKLFSGLPPNTSVGNPTFSKNSPYIIAFELIDENASDPAIFLLGGNLETGQVDTILQNNTISYPNFSIADDRLLINTDVTELFIFTRTDLYQVPLAGNKISLGGDPSEYMQNAQWGYWFATGSRVLTKIVKSLAPSYALKAYPNPVRDQLMVSFNLDQSAEVNYQLYNLYGQHLATWREMESSGNVQRSLQLPDLAPGTYLLRVNVDGQQGILKVSRF